MPIGNRIIILYRNDRVLLVDDAVFDVIVTKKANGHKKRVPSSKVKFLPQTHTDGHRQDIFIKTMKIEGNSCILNYINYLIDALLKRVPSC